MKKIFILSLFILFLSVVASSCKNDAETTVNKEKTTSPETAKDEVFAVADKFHTAFKNKNIEEIKNLLTGEGFFMGTDPAEVYNSLSFTDYLNKKLRNPAIGTIEYTIDRRELVLDDDGNGAIIVDQFNPAVFTQNIPWRMCSHLIKKDNSWKFNFISFSLTPDNDVLPAVNMAAYREE